MTKSLRRIFAALMNVILIICIAVVKSHPQLSFLKHSPAAYIFLIVWISATIVMYTCPAEEKKKK